MTDIKHEEVDLTDVEVQQCPYDAYNKLRDNATNIIIKPGKKANHQAI